MKLTLLEIIGNAVQLLLLVVLPVVLAIKNWDKELGNEVDRLKKKTKKAL
jgi:hypothetical protein